MQTTWRDALAAKASGRGRKMRVDHALVATCLDRAGVPRRLTDDVDALVVHGVEVMEVLKFLEFADETAVDGYRNGVPDGGLMLTVGDKIAGYPNLLARGVRILFVVVDLHDVPSEMRDEVGMWRDVLLSDDAIHDVLDACYGEAEREPLKLTDVDVGDVVLACRRRDRAAAIARLRLLAPTPEVEHGQDKDKDKPEEASAEEAKPLASAAEAVVRRLSQMTGFGLEATTWGLSLAADLRSYRNGELPWRDVDKGLLLSGPPGGGKTTFARSLALECGVDLVVTTYTDWSAEGGSHGDSISRGMKKLFDKWRKKSEVEGPFILLWDECDSIGRRGENGINESWFTAIINGWLAFLDGAVCRDGVVVIAATNFPDKVDGALLRPGRFDRHVALPMPDVAALAGIVAAHMHGGEVTDADRVAGRALRGRSPSQVELLCREARRLGRTLGRAADGQDVADLVCLRRGPTLGDEDWRVCVHEAAHALAALRMRYHRIVSVDVDSDGVVGGRVVTGRRDRVPTRAEAEKEIMGVLAGRAGEILLIGDHSAGCKSDLALATSWVHDLRNAWGMDGRLLSMDATTVDRVETDRLDAILQDCDRHVVALLMPQRAILSLLAERLREARYWDAEEFLAAVRWAGAEAFFGPANEMRAYEEFAEAA